MLMALGSFTFELKTAAFSSLKKSSEYRWSSSETIGNSPILQSLGKGSDRIDLEGVIYPDQVYGNSIDDLRIIAESQEPQILVDGTGSIHGFWVIKQIAETQSFFDKFGQPKKIEFNINLERYGEFYDL